MVGGYQEMLKSQPATYKLVLKNRKGFIKLIKKTGALLVPAISFGEVDLFETLEYDEKSKLFRFQMFMKNNLKIPIPMIRSFLPKRTQVVTVIGAPIDVGCHDINEAHAKFCLELEKLFDYHKSKYNNNGEKIKLEFE